MMLLKKIHHLANKSAETIRLIKDIKEIKLKVESLEDLLEESKSKSKVLEESLEEKNKKLENLELLNKNHSKDIKILANDVFVLSNFAKELWNLWEELGLDEFDLLDLRLNKEKKKNNYH